MGIGFVLQGMVIGLAVAAPVGPIGVLCVRRTLAEGRMMGLATGLGAASADAMYGGVAGFGLTSISGLLVHHQTWFELVGGLFLCYLGVRTFLAKLTESSVSTKTAGRAGAYVSTLFLTLTNPMTILSFAAIFAGLGITSGNNSPGATGALVVGVFLGSALWWLLLSGFVGSVGAGLDHQRLRWVNRLSGLVIGGFGVSALAHPLVE
jgi:threonine/homoserine/homoserine lactone efflux protein